MQVMLLIRVFSTQIAHTHSVRTPYVGMVISQFCLLIMIFSLPIIDMQFYYVLTIIIIIMISVLQCLGTFGTMTCL